MLHHTQESVDSVTHTINSFRESVVQTSSESYSSNRIQHNRDTAMLPVALTGLTTSAKGPMTCDVFVVKQNASNTIFLNFSPTIDSIEDVFQIKKKHEWCS